MSGYRSERVKLSCLVGDGHRQPAAVCGRACEGTYRHGGDSNPRTLFSTCCQRIGHIVLGTLADNAGYTFHLFLDHQPRCRVKVGAYATLRLDIHEYARDLFCGQPYRFGYCGCLNAVVDREQAKVHLVVGQ